MGNFNSNKRTKFGQPGHDRSKSFGSRARDSRGRNRSGGRGGSRGGEFRRKFVKVEVTCDKCGKMCDVPFKPTTGKPIYCRECFGSAGSDSSESNSAKLDSSLMTPEQFSEFNSKLDKILEILNSMEFEEIVDD